MTNLTLIADEIVQEEKMEELGLEFPKFEKTKIYNAAGEEIMGHAAITNVETREVSAVMSDRYTIFNHEDAFKIIDEAAKNLAPEVKGDVRFYSNDGYMKVQYDLPEQYNIMVGEGDPLRTRLVGYNSVDGSKTLSFHIDFLRLVCQNGMQGFSREFNFTRKHSRFIHEDTHDFNIAAQMEVAWKTVAENAATLKNNAVDYQKGMDAIKAMVERKLFPKKMQRWIEDEWKKSTDNTQIRSSADNGGNLWTLYNAFTNAITHSTNSKGEKLSDQQQELYGKRINSLIMKLAA